MYRNALGSVEVYCGEVEDKAYPSLSHAVTDLLCRGLGHGDYADSYIIFPAEALQLFDMADGLAVYGASHPFFVAVKAADYIKSVSFKAVVLQHSPAEVAHACHHDPVMVGKAEELSDIADELGCGVSHLGSAAAADGSKVLSDLHVIESQSFGDGGSGDIALLALIGERIQVVEVHRETRKGL